MKPQDRYFAMEEHVAGRWQLASIPMDVAAADKALADARASDASRRLRLVPAEPIPVADSRGARPSVQAAAVAIYRDCRKRAA